MKIRRPFLRNKKNGETLIETIVSLAIFSVVMLAVTTMVTVAYSVIEASEGQYKAINETVNVIEEENFDDPPEGTEVTKTGGVVNYSLTYEDVEIEGGGSGDGVDLYNVGGTGGIGGIYAFWRTGGR